MRVRRYLGSSQRRGEPFRTGSASDPCSMDSASQGRAALDACTLCRALETRGSMPSCMYVDRLYRVLSCAASYLMLATYKLLVFEWRRLPSYRRRRVREITGGEHAMCGQGAVVHPSAGLPAPVVRGEWGQGRPRLMCAPSARHPQSPLDADILCLASPTLSGSFAWIAGKRRRMVCAPP